MQKNLGYVIPSIVIPDAATNIGYWYLGSVPLGVRATGTMWTIGADHYWYVDNTKTEYLAEIPVEEYEQQWQELIDDCTEQWDTYYNNKTAEINLWFNTEGAQFTQWFNRIKNQLSSDAAGHLQLEIDSLVQSFSEHIEDYDISSDNYVVGDVLMYKNRLCRVVAAITAGDTFITDDSDPNQNIEYTTIFELAQGTPGVFYPTDAAAEADIANIEDGSIVYTNNGISRKENGSLVKKATKTLVDLVLNLTSNNAVANSAVTEDLNKKVTKFSGTDSGNTYVTVDQLAYDMTHKKLGLKVNGADTVIPFSSGGAKLVGTYSSNTTVNVSSYGATSANQFLLVPSQNASGAYTGYVGDVSSPHSRTYFTNSVMTLTNDRLSITLPLITTNVRGGYSGMWAGDISFYVPCKLYYVGDIS